MMVFWRSHKNEMHFRTGNVFLSTKTMLLMLFLAFLCFNPMRVFAAATPAGQWIMQQGSGAPTSSGDFISSSDTGGPGGNGLRTYYSYFIEVPSGTSNLTVSIFDADVGAGGIGESAQGRDRSRTGTWATSARYSLRNPAGTEVVTQTCNNIPTAFCADNAWSNLYAVSNPAAGHWELRVDMSPTVTTGDDINAFGIRAMDTGGNELNIYAPSFYEVGVNADNPPVMNTYYPFISSGCTFDANNFDWDYNNGGVTDVGSITYTSGTGSFTNTNNAPSASDTWQSTAITGWTSDILSADYGIWSQSVSIKTYAAETGNYGVIYTGNFNAANPPPTGQPQANTFRVYLPTNGGSAPNKPIVGQAVTYVSGPNPPLRNQTTTVRIWISVFNPSPYSITFSSPNNLVTANVPATRVTYVGNSGSASQGTIISQPSNGGNGNITWNPGTVGPGVTTRLYYNVNVTPSANTQRTRVTGTTASNGTRAVYLDETGNATYNYGPLCELAITSGTAIPTLAVISFFSAYEDNGRVVARWETSAEHNTLGFYLLRLNEVTGKYETIDEKIVPALVGFSQGGIYRLVDGGAFPGRTYTYKLQEVEMTGARIEYGPFRVAVDGIPVALSLEPMVSAMSRTLHGAPNSQKTRKGMSKITKEDSKARDAVEQGSRIKISVTEDGLYFLGASEISALLGQSLSQINQLIRNNRLSLTRMGQKVAYLPAEGDSGIFFYGQKIESIYTRENIYWLAQEKGLQMKSFMGDRPKDSASGDQFFPWTLHIEEDKVPAPSLFTNPEADIWFWDFIFGDIPDMDRKTFALHAKGVAKTGSTATLTVHLQGASDSGSDRDHHAIVSLNGHVIGEGRWKGTVPYTIALPFSQDLLDEGDNTVEVRGVLDSGVPFSLFLIDSFDLDYNRLYGAENDALLCIGNGHPVVSITGFTTNQISVFDITAPMRPKYLLATTIGGTRGNYRVSFTPSSPDSLYFAVSGAAISAADLSVDTPSELSSKGNRADYLILAPSPFKETTQSLAAYRKAQGLETRVVTLEDVMDEFNYGILDPKAIKNLLSYAYLHWEKAPRYVVLVGKGSYDYRDNLGQGGSLMPPMMRSTPFGLFASDNSFVDVDGDSLPEMAIGRLPAATIEELQTLIDKIIAYENAGEGLWEKNVLMVADTPDEGGDFHADSDSLVPLIPSEYTVDKIYWPSAEAQNKLLGAINAGVLLLNYAGHSSTDGLAHDWLVCNDRSCNLDSLMNGEKLPVMVALTCFMNNFADPVNDILGERLVMKSDGGAIAVWGPTGLSLNSEAVALGKNLFQAVFGEGKKILGDAVLQALGAFKKSGGETFMLDIYSIVGDPALRIR